MILNNLIYKGIYSKKKIMFSEDKDLPHPCPVHFFFGFIEENEKYYFGDKIPNRRESFGSKNKQLWQKSTLQRKRTLACSD